MKKVAVLGHFSFGQEYFDGQTVKTKSLVCAMKKNIDVDIVSIDTHGWLQRPITLLREIHAAFVNCDAVIMLPAHNGVKIFSSLFVRYKKKYKKKIFYDVIGGWLPVFVSEKPRLARTLKKFDGIWVETSTMKTNLENQGFTNVFVVPNFKDLPLLSKEELIYPDGKPYRVCTFSRVMKEKGIEDAINAVKSVNEGQGKTVYMLDIYGQVDSEQAGWFEALKKEFPSYIRYMGIVSPDESVNVLRNYFAMLFPTYYEGEGVAGTLIDAYSAGIPVIASDWRYNAEIVNEKTGYVYPVRDNDALTDMLINVADNPSLLLSKKQGCLEEAKKYNAETVINYLITMLQN